MAIAALILVEPSQPGNLGAVLRLAANFGVRNLELVRPGVEPDDPEAVQWACGGNLRVKWRRWETLPEAAAEYHTVVASASGRGRRKLPVMTPGEATPVLYERGLDGVALVFGNETRGLRREDLDCCDLVIRVPTEPDFPVLNLAQAVAVLVSQLHLSDTIADTGAPPPAALAKVEGLMSHLRASLLEIGFLDPQNPDRILRQLRRLFGRAGISEDEVRILRGICRQMEWAANAKPGRFSDDNEGKS